MSKTRFMFRSAVYLFLKKGNQLFFLRRYNTGWEDGKYTLVAGHVDGNESIYSAMAREAFEEVGLLIAPSDLQVVHTMHRRSTDAEYFDIFVEAKVYRGIPTIKEPDKADELKWFDMDQLPKNVLPGVKKAIELIKTGVRFSEFGFEV